MFDEAHDLRSLPGRKNCWVGVNHQRNITRPDGSAVTIPTSIAYFSSSETGWDRPLELDVLPINEQPSKAVI